MPSPQQERLMELLATESGPITASALAKKAGLTTESASTQLSRLAREEMVVKDAQGEWILTEAGSEYVTTPSQETAGTSEYEIFMSLGRRIGVTGDLIRVVAEHVWSGGDYEDVNWVWKALGEMDIRTDQRKRWCNAWRSHLGKAIPPELREEMAKVSAKGEQEEEGVAKKEGRDYIIVGDVPVFAGEGAGDMSMKDAKDVISMRALQARVAASQGGGSPQPFGAKDIIDIIEKINEGRGNAPPSKSYVVTPTPESTRVEEIEEGKPIVVGTGSPALPMSYLVDPEGKVSELKPGEPIVVKPSNAPEPTPVYIVQPDGAVKKVDPGEPVVIKVQPAPTSTSLPVPMTDKDGNPILTLDLAKFLGDEKRADEKMDQIKALVASFREKVAPALATWLGRMPGPKTPATSEEETAQGFEGPCPSCGQTISLNAMPTGEFTCPHCNAVLSPPEG